MDWQIARMSNGIFYFRLEDTDKKREITGSGFVALNILKQFGIVPNEGTYVSDGTQIGNYGPYVQSKRLDIYHLRKRINKKRKSISMFLPKNRKHWRRFAKNDKNNLKAEDIIEKDPCRNLTYEEIRTKYKRTKNHLQFV